MISRVDTSWEGKDAYLRFSYGVRPIDVGLNGVMIAENETERRFTLECRPFVKPEIRTIYAVGIVEALVPTEHSSAPVQLEVGSAESHRAAR